MTIAFTGIGCSLVDGGRFQKRPDAGSIAAFDTANHSKMREAWRDHGPTNITGLRPPG